MKFSKFFASSRYKSANELFFRSIFIVVVVILFGFYFYFAYDEFISVGFDEIKLRKNGSFDNFLFLVTSKRWIKHFNVQKCLSDPRYDCGNLRISSSFRDFPRADVVIFHPGDFKFKKLPKKRPVGQLWVWLNMEPPQNVNWLNISDHIFNYTASFRSDSDIFLPYGYFVKKPQDFVFQRPSFKSFKEKKKLICWLVSNWKSNFRGSYYKELRQYVDIDVYGKKSGQKRSTPKCSIISNYKFYLSFENLNLTDYITEKLWYNAFQCGAIPIVLGATKEEYLKQNIPADSFIYAKDFKNASDLVNYIQLVANNETLYNSYFNWRKGRDIYFEDTFGEYFCRILNYFNRFHPAPHKDLVISKWFPYR